MIFCDAVRYDEKHLRKMTLDRLKKYYRAQQARYNNFQRLQDMGRDDYADKEEFERWYKYIMFVKAIKLSRENEES